MNHNHREHPNSGHTAPRAAGPARPARGAIGPARAAMRPARVAMPLAMPPAKGMIDLARDIARCALMAVACCLAGAALLAGLAAQPAHAEANQITGFRIGHVERDGRTALRVVVETRGPIDAGLILLAEPYRFVVDMPDTRWSVKGLATSGPLGRAPATKWRFGNPKPGIGRLVIEMSAPAVPVRRIVLPAEGGGRRLVFDLVDRGPTAFQLAARAVAEEGTRRYDLGDFGGARVSDADRREVERGTSRVETRAPSSGDPARAARRGVAGTGAAGEGTAGQDAPRALPIPIGRRGKWVVFIDAGHGGKDSGAIGVSHTREKDITLAAARELKKRLDATGKVEAVLTRGDDRFLRLRERIERARERNAELFVSLHADAAPTQRARGISVFTLSDTASDSEAAHLARNENKADLIGGPDLATQDPVAADELLRMFQRESRNQSTHLANAIIEEIHDMPGGERGHRFAGFAVLKAPDIPSVLVEMGFMTNRHDEANLKSASYRARLTTRLKNAIITYLEEHGPKRR